MSDRMWWLTDGAAQYLEHTIRGTLGPLAERYRAQAFDLGSAPEHRYDRAHHIGRSQGLQDAVHALLFAFGLGPEVAEDLPAYPAPQAQPISPGNRRAGNASARWTPDLNEGR